MTFEDFGDVVINDFEYHHDGFEEGPPVPVCCCAKELRSGREYRLWEDELRRHRQPPYAHGPHDLFVSFNAPAELSCYAMLGWPMPRNVLDLCIEYRQHANGRVEKGEKRDLVHAMQHFDLPGIEAVEKKSWQDLILTGGPFDADERAGILDYCWTDITATEALLKAMRAGSRCRCSASLPMPQNLARAWYRGRYTLPVAETLTAGIPIDSDTWEQILKNRHLIQQDVIRAISPECSVYDGTAFSHDGFAELLGKLGLLRSWPRCARSSKLSTDREVFRTFSWHPQIERLRQVRQVVQQLRKPSFTVNRGRNYYGILPFKAESSRNATVGCIFQAPAWLRGLIQPKPGTGLIYCDYAQEEFFIAGVLSGDAGIEKTYETGDPYLRLAVLAGLVPPNGTKAQYKKQRDWAKPALLAIQYGMKAAALAARLGVSRHCAEDLISGHKRDYPALWKWMDQAVAQSRWKGSIETVYGWRLAVNGKTKDNTLRNFKVQGCGAEVLRLASLLLWEAGIKVVAPVHDAFLVECAERDVEDVARETQRLMVQSSEHVLNGHRLRVDFRILRHPDRLLEPRGLVMWDQIRAIENRLSRAV